MGSLSRRINQQQRAKAITHTRLQSPGEVLERMTPGQQVGMGALALLIEAVDKGTSPEWFDEARQLVAYTRELARKTGFDGPMG